MVSLLWPVQASSRPRGPWKPRWAESIQDSINLLASPPLQTDPFSESRQTARTLKLSIFQRRFLGTVNHQEELRLDSGCLFHILHLPPMFNLFSSQKRWQGWNGLGRLFGAMSFWLLESHLGNTSADVKWKLMLWSTSLLVLHSGYRSAEMNLSQLIQKQVGHTFTWKMHPHLLSLDKRIFVGDVCIL